MPSPRVPTWDVMRRMLREQRAEVLMVFSSGKGTVRELFAGRIKSGFPRAYNLTTNTMSLDKVTPGAKAPDQFNVIIEIPMNADPVKYEVDKESGALFVDRFMSLSLIHI